MKNREIVRILESHNFRFVRSNRHMLYSNGLLTVAVPHHKQCSKGLARRIFQQAGLNKEIIQQIL